MKRVEVIKADMIKIIEDVLDYRDGNFYVGDLTYSRVCSILEIHYPPPDNFSTILKGTSFRIISKVYDYLLPYILHMKRNPKVKCPTCGSIVDEYILESESGSGEGSLQTQNKLLESESLPPLSDSDQGE